MNNGHTMNDTFKPTIGYIGLGVMGAPMAANLLQAGYRVVVHDVRPEAAAPHMHAGAIWAQTPRDLSLQSDVIFSCLPSLQAIEQVVLGEDGVCAGIRPGAAFLEMSTSTKELVHRLHAAVAERGAHMLDAPISGGASGAKTRRMAIWVGGEESVFLRVQPVLQALADHPAHVGEIGAGLVTKLIHNCAMQSAQAAIAEAFVLGVKTGLKPLELWRALRQGVVGRRRTFDDLFAQFLVGEYDGNTTAPLWVVDKDVQSACQLALDFGVPMRFANLALADIQEAVHRGWSQRDCRSVMLLPQERVGIEIKVDREDIQNALREDPPAPTDVKFGAGALV